MQTDCLPIDYRRLILDELCNPCVLHVNVGSGHQCLAEQSTQLVTFCKAMTFHMKHEKYNFTTARWLLAKFR